MKKSGLFKQLGFAALVAAAGVCTWGWASARSGSSSPEGAAALRSDEGVEVINETFKNGFPKGWITKDADGDGKNFSINKWQNHGEGANIDFTQASASIGSDSWAAQAVNNYLITPRLNLPNGGKVSYWVTTYYGGGQYAEKYSVCYSTTGTNPEDFQALKTETLQEHMVMKWQNYILDLPANTKYVAFRHHDCKVGAINFDDIRITGVGGALATDLPTYAITVENTERGVITVNGNGAAIPDLQTVAEGTQITVSATANEGFVFHGIKVNNITLPRPDEGDYTFNLGENVTISAIFKKPTFRVSLPWRIENGTAQITDVDGNVLPQWEPVEEGTTIKLKLTPDAGYKVGEVKKDGELLPEPYQFTVTADVNIEITFVPDGTAGVATLLENFDGEGVSDEALPDGWTRLKNSSSDEWTQWSFRNIPDGAAHSPAGFMRSFASSGTTFANYLITPKLALTEVSELSVFVRTGSAIEVPFKIVGSKTENTKESFTEVLLTENLTKTTGYVEKKVSVPTDIKYIAFVHEGTSLTMNTTVFLDNVKLDVPAVATYAVNLVPTDKGTVRIQGKTAEELAAIPQGTKLTVVPMPNQGYEVKEVLVNGVAITAPYEFTVERETTVTATFQKKEVIIYVTSLSETFDKGNLDFDENTYPEGWRVTSKGGEDFWRFTNSGAYSAPGCLSSYGAANKEIDQRFISPELVLTEAATLTFYCRVGDDAATLRVLGSKSETREESTFTEVLFEEEIQPSEYVYTLKTVAIPADIKSIAFVHSAPAQEFSTNMRLDDIFLHTTYPVELETATNGTLTIAGKTAEELRAVKKGTELTVVATPAEGYELEEVRVNDQPLAAPYKFTVTKATKVSAKFRAAAVTTVAVKVEKIGEGTVTIRENENKVYTDEMLKAVPVGSFLELIATPAEGYVLKSVLVNGAAPADDPIFFSVTEETNIVVKFEKKAVYYAVTLAPTENGTISIKDKTAEQLKSIKEGTELTVEVTPNQGYVLHSLTANGADIKGTRTFKVAANTEVKAVFAKENAIDGVNGQVARIYPNPAQEFVVVEGVEANTIVRIAMMDGRFVAEANADETGAARFNVAAWARGNYLVVINGKAQVVVLR